MLTADCAHVGNAAASKNMQTDNDRKNLRWFIIS
jgi:hypothetical protein